MEAYEFYAKPENGFIKIPELYRNRIVTEVKVIILYDKSFCFNREVNNARRKSDLLLPPSLDTKNWKFSREEANERR